MSLCLVPIAGGVADLGTWGALELTGSASALIRARRAADIELPPSVAGSLPDVGLVLNDATGEMLVLPYADDVIARIALDVAEEPFSCTTIPRDADRGLRLAHRRLIADQGVLFMTEQSLLLFDANLRLAWQCDEDFGAWIFDRVEDDRLHLRALDAAGREHTQARSLADGRRLG